MGPIQKVDPLFNPTIGMAAQSESVPIPPLLAERIEAAEEDGLNMVRIMLSMFALSGFPKKTLAEFTRPYRHLAVSGEFWNPEDYPQELEVPFFLKFNRESLLYEFANTLLSYGYAIVVSPMHGCEPVTIALATNRNLSSPLWLGAGFTKTQYADDFPRAHELVCQVLDIAKEEGLLHKVQDTCKYYEGRDWSSSMKIANRELDFTWMVSKLLNSGIDELKKQGVEVEAIVDNASTISPPSARPGPRDWHEAFEDKASGTEEGDTGNEERG